MQKSILEGSKRGLLLVLGIGVAALAQALAVDAAGDAQPSKGSVGAETRRFIEQRRKSFDAGDGYQTPGGTRKLFRLRGAVALQMKAGVDKTSGLRILTAAGAPLAGYTEIASPAKDELILEAPPAGGVKKNDSLTASQAVLARVRSHSLVQRANPVFVDPASGFLLLSTSELIVRLKPGTDPKAFFGSDRSNVRPLLGTEDQFVLAKPGATAEEVLTEANRLSGDDRVVWAEPNFVSQAIKYRTPNDPLFPQQVHLNNTGQGGGIAGADIRATSAWNRTTGSSNIVVAVVDDAVEISHPDLAANIFSNPGETANGVDDDGNGYIDDLHGWNFYDNNNNPNPYDPDDTHGTCTAGCAAAVGDNALGVAGVAYNCRILPIKVFRGDYIVANSTLAEAFYYAAGRAKNGTGRWRGADVISVSLGLAQATVLDDALHWGATQGRGGKGCPIFASSGNSGSGWYYPDYEYVSGLSAGTHTFKFEYSKDYNYADGEDTVWLDDVTFPGGEREGFEGSFPPAGWTTGGSASWTQCTRPDRVLGTGTKSAQSGHILDSQSTYLQVTKTTPAGTLTWNAWTSTEQDYDVLNVYVDGVLQFTDPGGVNEYLTSISYPASHTEVIAVGASTDYDYRADFSQFGTGLALLAPGGGGDSAIYTTDCTGTNGYNTTSGTAGNYFADFGGTSAAAPIAAGVGALVLSMNSNLTASAVKSLLCNSADKVGQVAYVSGWNAYYGYGRVNAYAALTSAYVNSAPTLDSIANLTINEDAPTTNITLTGIGTSPDSGQTVTNVTASSSNAGLIPSPSVSYTPGNTTGNLSFAPVANANGTATITVIVKDNGGTANGGVDSKTNAFTVTVNVVNDPPTMNSIANLTINEDAPTTNITLTGIGTGPDSGQTVTNVTASSSNIGLIPTPSVTYTVGNTTGSLSFAPVANANGAATITVIVKDNGGTANGGVGSKTNTFTVTVNAVNDPPTFSKGPDQCVLTNSGLQSVANWATAISAGPPNESGQTLNFMVTNNNNSLFSAPPAVSATGTLTYTPAINAAGKATVSVKLHDNGGTANGGVDTSAEQIFTITVVPRPLILSLLVTNAGARLTWNSVSGVTYRVQYRTNLVEDASWWNLFPDLLANGPIVSTTNQPLVSRRFYRILVP